MRRKCDVLIFVVIIICLITLFGKLYAQEQETLRLTALIDKALKQNPQIEVLKQKYEATKARIPQARTLENPSFEYKYDKMTASMDAVMEGKTAPMRTFALSQEIPFPTKLLLKSQIAAKEAQMAYQDYKEKEREIIAQVKTLYAQLAFIYKSQEITLENKTLLEQLAKTASTRYSLGKANQQDALKAQLEIAKMDNELIMLDQKRQVVQAKINVLLSQDAGTELGWADIKEVKSADYNLKDLNQMAKNNRPELKAARLALERARKTYSLAKQEYLPDFMVKYEQMERDNRLTDWAGMVGVTLPLWFWQKENFNVRQMKSELKMVEAEYKEKENMVFLEVKEAFVMQEAAKKLALLYRTAYLPQAEQTVKTALNGYESGQIDFLNLLDTQRMLLEFKLEYYKALIDYEVALAELNKAVGI